jgi:hypothetical protein
MATSLSPNRTHFPNLLFLIDKSPSGGNAKLKRECIDDFWRKARCAKRTQFSLLFDDDVFRSSGSDDPSFCETNPIVVWERSESLRSFLRENSGARIPCWALLCAIGSLLLMLASMVARDTRSAGSFLDIIEAARGFVLRIRSELVGLTRNQMVA